jgi:hypothetical protein
VEEKDVLSSKKDNWIFFRSTFFARVVLVQRKLGVLFLQKVATLFAGANLGVKIFYLVLLSIL